MDKGTDITELSIEAVSRPTQLTAMTDGDLMTGLE